MAEADKNYLWWAVIAGFSDAADLLGDQEWAEALYDLAAPYAGHNATLGVASFLGAADHGCLGQRLATVWVSIRRAANGNAKRPAKSRPNATVNSLGN